MDEEIKLSIFCLTYNHVSYIEQAIESFLNQEVSFKYNIFIFDDASNDGTSEIVRRYQKDYPDIINAYISPHNTYNLRNRRDIIKELSIRYLKGKYIACCEGDDYWIDNKKLQKQVDFLDNNDECSMVSHSFLIYDCSNNTWKEKHILDSQGYIAEEDIIMQPNGNLASASLVMRKEAYYRDGGFPACDVDDFPMQLCAISFGRVFYINEVMSVYRYMHKGSWCYNNTADSKAYIDHAINFITFLDKYNIYTEERFGKSVWKKMVEYASNIISVAFENGIPEITTANEKYCNLTNRLNQILSWLNNRIVNSEEVKKLEKAKHIYIMGNGFYSRIIYNTLKKNGFEIDGIVVSNNGNESNGIFEISTIKDIPECLLVVAINQKNEEDIIITLKKNDITKYITPIWIARKDILVNERTDGNRSTI